MSVLRKRSKSRTQVEKEVTESIRIGNENDETCPFTPEGSELCSRLLDIESDYFTVNAYFESLLKKRDTSKTLLRSVIICCMNSYSSIRTRF